MGLRPPQDRRTHHRQQDGNGGHGGRVVSGEGAGAVVLSGIVEGTDIALGEFRPNTRNKFTLIAAASVIEDSLHPRL